MLELHAVVQAGKRSQGGGEGGSRGEEREGRAGRAERGERPGSGERCKWGEEEKVGCLCGRALAIFPTCGETATLRA